MYTVPADTPWWRAWVYGGHTAPALFLVLSAFLLSRSFLAELRGGRRVDVPNYFLRRGLRILPLYATTILVAVLVVAPTGHSIYLCHVPVLLFGRDVIKAWYPRCCTAGRRPPRRPSRRSARSS